RLALAPGASLGAPGRPREAAGRADPLGEGERDDVYGRRGAGGSSRAGCQSLTRRNGLIPYTPLQVSSYSGRSPILARTSAISRRARARCERCCFSSPISAIV